MRGAWCIRGLRLAVAGLAALSAAAAEVSAASTPAVQASEPPPDWLDETHKTTTERLRAAVLAVDRFFGTEQYLQDSTKSFLRLIANSSFDSNGDEFEFDIQATGRLDLPGTMRRFSVLISGDTTDADTSPTAVVGEDEETEITLERNPQGRREHWKVRPGVGLRGGFSPTVYGQVRATRYDRFAEHWLARTQGTMRYLSDVGWEARGELDLSRFLDTQWAFRARTDLRWIEDDQSTRAFQSFSFSRPVGESTAIAHSLRIEADDRESWGVSRYRYIFAWRTVAYRDWLVFEVRPEVALKEENDYDPSASLLLRVEAWFGKLPL